MGVGIGLLVSWGTKKITEAAQRVQNVATKSKEAADAAQSTTSSLKDLVSAYEELGDKSGWGTEDFDQAKDIQAEILDLAKEQGTLDENKLGKLDLQNGKYEEQLGLLQDITAEQLEASRYELTQNKDAQGDKLVDTAKKNNRTHYLTVWSAPEMDMGDQIKNAGIDIFNKFGGYGPDDLKDADSIVDYYNEVGKALKYVIDNTTEAERAAGGTYHSLYQFLLDEQTALRDDVDSYNDSTDAINNNTNARRELQAVDFWQNDNNNSMDVSFTFDKVNSAVQTLEDTIDGFDASKLNELLWGTNEGLSDEQAQALANLRKALTDMDFSADTNGVNAFIQALVQVGIVAQSSANDVDAVAQASQKMEDISSKIDEIQTAYKNATTAIEEYNKYGYLSADTLQTLLNEDFEYLSCLELVDGQLQVNTEKYQGMIAAQYQSAAMALVEKANAELAKIAQGEKKDAVEDATKATEDQATALTERVCPALGEFAKASMTAAAAQEFLANGDAAWSVDPERTKEVYAGLASGLDILDATVDQIMGNSDKFRQHMNGFDKETKNRNKNTAKSVTDVASAFDTLNKAMKEYNQYGCLCADTAKSLIGLDDKFTACLTKQGDMLQINVEQFRKFVKEQLKEANAAKDGGKSADEMNKILNYLDQNVDTTTISFEQLTDAIKGYGTAMDEAKEKTDAIKSAFSDLYSVGLNKQDNDFGFLDSDDEKKKKYLAEFDKMTYDDMISYNENWKNSILGNMKSTQVVTNVNEIITKIEKLITTIETLNNVLTAIRTHGASTDGGGLTGLFSKNGLFGNIGNFISTAKTKGLETAAKEAIGTFLDNTGAMLEANADNPVIKAATGLWDKLKGIFSGKIVATGVEAGVDETLATLAKKEVVQKGAGNLLTRFGGAAAATGAKTATTVTTGISSIPVVGTLIAVAVNNAVQQFGKISKENTKIWADQNSTTGEKIVSSVGNVLYHLSPVEGWDKSVQYAKMAAEGEGLWQKLEYGAKSLYYATGLGVMLDNIWSTIKSILKVFGVKFKESGDGVSTSSSVSGKKGVGSWKIWPWNWGKKAKGDKKIKKSAPYNVDEEGDEIIVRKPQTGRMTYLEKGDGVIPANETENLMTIGKNPLKWLTENVGKILGASAAKDVVEGKVDEGAVTKASKVLASSVVNTFSSAWNSVKMSTEDLIDSMNDSFQGGSTSVTTAAGTILSRVKTMFGKFNMGKLLGSFSSGVSGAISKSAKEYSSTTELLSGTKSKTIDTMNKMRSTFESTWASVAKETGVSKDKITSISSEMFSKMEALVNQTYDAIDSNAGMSSDQLNDITKSLFQSMQSIYTSGWNAVYATSTGMSQETANTLNSAYKSSSDGCTKAMDIIRNTMVGSWEQCGGGVQNLANGTYQTLSKAWADSSGSAEKMLYDTRACFDSGWGAVEQGVSSLANNPKDKLSTAWAEITSQSNATFGAEGTLKTDADNAWKNVEPGATNLSKNMQWTMDQAYLATKQGCSDTVNSVNTNLNSTSAGFSAIASAIDAVNKKASDSEEVAKNTGHAWYEWVLNPVGTLLDTVTKYNTEDKSKNNFLQNAVHTVTHPISSVVESVKYLGNAAKDFFGGLFGKHASGLKSACTKFQTHILHGFSDGPVFSESDGRILTR